MYSIPDRRTGNECVRFTFYSFCILKMAGFISNLFCIHFEVGFFLGTNFIPELVL